MEKNPTNVKLKKAQRELIDAYQKEPIEHIQGQINNIRNSVEDRQSRIAWQTVNEVSKKKSILWAKLKPTSQEEQIQMWKEHFKNLLENFPKVTGKPITKIINNQEVLASTEMQTKWNTYVLIKKETSPL